MGILPDYRWLKGQPPPKEETPQALAPRTPWDVFTRKHFTWEAGEHVAIVGPTGSGKTELLSRLILQREYAVVFATKPRDATMDALIENNEFELYSAWKSESAEKHPRRVIWPDATAIDAKNTQRKVFADAFGAIFREGAWNLFLDEGYWIAQTLGLDEEIRVYLLQARSLDISLILATQRPVSVPTEVWDQSTWLFLARESDERNLDRISGISWRSAKQVRHLVANLERYQFLVVNTRTGQMWRTRAPVPVRGGVSPS